MIIVSEGSLCIHLHFFEKKFVRISLPGTKRLSFPVVLSSNCTCLSFCVGLFVQFFYFLT